MEKDRATRVVITGAASGIGLAVARSFASAGAEVVFIDLKLESNQRAALDVASETGAVTLAFGCDVSNEAEVDATFAKIGSPVDVLVNCAGIAHVGSLATTSVTDMDRLYAVNVRGTYLCMKSALAAMTAAGRGVILNLASIAATAGLSDRFAYSMTKGAVLSMTLSVARDYLQQGIRCLCISPARVHTPFVDGFLKENYPGREAEKMKVLAGAQPIGRMGTPEEVASLALFLCSDAASFMTGVDIPLDGGFFNLR